MGLLVELNYWSSIRRRARLPQSAIATAAGVSRSFVAAFEKGRVAEGKKKEKVHRVFTQLAERDQKKECEVRAFYADVSDGLGCVPWSDLSFADQDFYRARFAERQYAWDICWLFCKTRCGYVFEDQP